jgi:hypothetical protein
MTILWRHFRLERWGRFHTYNRSNNHVASACFPSEDDDLVTSFPPGKVRQISQLNKHVAPACLPRVWRHFRQERWGRFHS